MEHSRADRLLADWDRIARQAARPGLPARTTAATRVPVSTIAGAALLALAVLVAGVWFTRPAGFGQLGPSSSPSPALSSAAATDTWGPLAVIPAQDGVQQARNEGTLRITDDCVFLEATGGGVELLVWPADMVTWQEDMRLITFENLDGTTVTLTDGDQVVLGGGGESAAEGGLPGEEWIRRTEWVAPPAASCTLDPRWRVGNAELERTAAPSQSSPVPTGPWGPLAVVPPQDGTDLARNEGTLQITDDCVYLDSLSGDLYLLLWLADRTTWSVQSGSITFENFDGSVVSLSDGDQVVLGGSGGSGSEDGTSGGDWVKAVEWVAPPASSCSLDHRWLVGVVEG